MPVGSEVLSGFFLSGFSSSEIWNKFSSGHAATTIHISHSKKRLICGFLYVQISLWALSLTALRESVRQISETGLSFQILHSHSPREFSVLATLPYLVLMGTG